MAKEIKHYDYELDGELLFSCANLKQFYNFVVAYPVPNNNPDLFCVFVHGQSTKWVKTKKQFINDYKNGYIK